MSWKQKDSPTKDTRDTCTDTKGNIIQPDRGMLDRNQSLFLVFPPSYLVETPSAGGQTDHVKCRL